MGQFFSKLHRKVSSRLRPGAKGASTPKPDEPRADESQPINPRPAERQPDEHQPDEPRFAKLQLGELHLGELQLDEPRFAKPRPGEPQSVKLQPDKRLPIKPEPSTSGTFPSLPSLYYSSDPWYGNHYSYYDFDPLPGRDETLGAGSYVTRKATLPSFTGSLLNNPDTNEDGGAEAADYRHSGFLKQEDGLLSSPPSQDAGEQGYCCLIPGCNATIFKREADLDRHHKHKHIPEDQQHAWCCDYSRCNRRSPEAPFRRKDHLRDHLRDFHKEDLAKRGKTYSTDNTGQDCNINNSWWRCPRCLIRVHITSNGYQCPDCHTTCDDARKRKRQS